MIASVPLVFDSFIFGVTVFCTYRHVKVIQKQEAQSITEVVLRDGQLKHLY